MGSGGVCGYRRNSISPETSAEQAQTAARAKKIMSCEGCTKKFSLVQRKKHCDECHRCFCSMCVMKDRTSSRQQLCSRCKVLLTRPLNRADLMQLRIKDLQHYLMSRHVSMKSCVEKEDLVNLILQYVGGPEAAQPQLSREYSSPTRVAPSEEEMPADIPPSADTTGRVADASDQAPFSPIPLDCPEGQSVPTVTSQSSGPDTLPGLVTINPFQESATGLTQCFSRELDQLTDPLNSDESSNMVSADRDNQLKQPNDQIIPGSESVGADHVGVSSASSSVCSSCSCSLNESSELFAHSDSSVSHLELNQDGSEMQSEFNQEREPESENIGFSDSAPHDQENSGLNNSANHDRENIGLNNSGDHDQENSGLRDSASHDQENSGSCVSPPRVDPQDPWIEPTTADITEELSAINQHDPVSLADIRITEQLEQLTVKQLKNLLGSYCVDYKGCCEKYELLERAKRLWQDEQEARRVVEGLPDDALCKICMDAAIDCVMLECGHMATCTSCGKKMHECPICRQYVIRVVRTFKV